MRDLRLVGLSEDRQHVVLRSDTGEQFRVPADERLRVALRGDRARLGQLEIQMDSALRPRDIQARIRGGETPEAVAAAAQVPLERIMGYAVPVLAEREHMCGRARRATLRRKHTTGPTRLLGDAVDERLRERGTDPRRARWDSWRRDDGRWAICVTPPDGGAPATYVFDVPGRYAVASDDEARSLVGDRAPVDDPTEMAIASAVAEAQLTTMPAVSSDPTADTDAAVTSIHRARSRRVPPGEELPLDGLPLPEPVERARAVGDDDIDALARATADPSGAPGTEPRRRRERRRTSVPSWDEIMFGGKPRGE